MTFHRVRVALLTLTLVLVSAWGAGQYRRRAARTRWTRPLRVSVAVLSRHPVPPDALTAFRQGLGGLETHLAEEFRRYRPGVATPFSLVMAGPAHPDPLPPWAPEGGGVWARLNHAMALRRALDEANRRAGVNPRHFDVRLYLTWEPSPDPEARFAEGVAEAGGEVGMVRAAFGSDDLTLALTAVAHELLHCLGATDKYDPSGRAVAPGGLAEPDRVPPYPQRFAEVMVGEVPLTPSSGRLAVTLEEVRVGPATAEEIRWTAPR